jgi:hypothetical protein
MNEDYLVRKKIIVLNYFGSNLRLNIYSYICHFYIEFVNIIVLALFYNVVIFLKNFNFSFKDNLRV